MVYAAKFLKKKIIRTYVIMYILQETFLALCCRRYRRGTCHRYFVRTISKQQEIAPSPNDPLCFSHLKIFSKDAYNY